MKVTDLAGDLSVVVTPYGKASFQAEVWEGPRNSSGRIIRRKHGLTTDHSALVWATAFGEGWRAARATTPFVADPDELMIEAHYAFKGAGLL